MKAVEGENIPRMYFFRNLAYTFLYAYGWGPNESIDENADNIVKESFRRGMLESINDNEDLDYDIKNLLTARIRKWLKKTHSSEELKELKEKLMKIKKQYRFNY
jgi:hypothetical protein